MDQADERLKDSKDLMLTIAQFLSENHVYLEFSDSRENVGKADEQLMLSLLALGQEADDYLFKLNYYRLAISTCLVTYYSIMQDDPTKKTALLADLIDSYMFSLGPISMPLFQALIDLAQTHLRLKNWKGAKEYALQARDAASFLFCSDDVYFPEIDELVLKCKVEEPNPVM